jgi:membrane protease YdiL (CAAX protease family)
MSDDSSKKPAWGIPAGLIITLIAVVLMQPIAAILVSFYPMVLGWDSVQAEEWLFNSPVSNFVSILTFEVLAVAVIAAFTFRRRVSFWVATALGKIRWRDLIYAVVGFLVYLGLAIAVFAILPIFFPIDTNQEQAIGFDPGAGGLTLLLAFIGLVVLPPIAEELIFRGFLYGTLRANKVSFVWAALVTSLLFGSLHLLGGASGGLLWVGLVDTFVLSLVLCYVREETGTLWASIGIHAFKNGLVFLNLFVINAT